MSISNWLTLVACAGHLALALLVAARGGRSPLVWPLFALCVDFFLFNAADVAGAFSSTRGWVWIDVTAASLLTPIALHLVLGFVGRRVEYRAVLGLAYGLFGAVAAVCASAFLVPASRRFAGSTAWAVILLTGSLPLLVFAAETLRRHLRDATSEAERSRTYVFIMAFAIGALGCLAELITDAGAGDALVHTRASTPAAVGTLGSTLLLAAIVLRFQLLERKVSYVLATSAVIAGIVQLMAYSAAFRYFGGPEAILVLGTLLFALALVPALRGASRSHAIHRERVEQLTTLGRLSAQLAHDLKNPLAAIKGAAQYLREEIAQGRSAALEADYVVLIEEQADRMARVIDEYQRIGRVEPVFSSIDLDSLARGVANRQSLAACAGVVIRSELATGELQCDLDGDLITAALENMVRNAMEALPETGGNVTVRTARVQASGRKSVVITVEDDGCGIDARSRERVFEEFFTTKAQGVGLGLAFVRRVARAHGGDATIDSTQGLGTSVRMRIPIRARS